MINIGRTSTEVKQRWIKANYHKISAYLRFDRHQQIIDFVEKERAKGLGTTEIIVTALEYYMKEIE